MLIKNINTLLRQFSGDKKTMYCDFCGTTSFKNKKSLSMHEKRCQTNKQEICMPKSTELKFKNFDHKLRVPFKIYADFESYFETNNDKESTAQVTYLTKHKMMGWGYKVVGDPSFGSMIDYNVKTGNLIKCQNKTIEEDFIENLLMTLAEINCVLQTKKPIQMTPADEHNFKTSVFCFFCDKELGSDRVRDHDHLTGKQNKSLK